MNTHDIAWLAGIMEGEGTFAIYHQKRKGKDLDCLRGNISVTNTDPGLMNKCYDIFKSMGIEMHMHEYTNKKGSTKPVYDMQTSRADYVKIACEILMPYLFGEKNAKAKMLLRFVTKRLEKRQSAQKALYDKEDWDQFHQFRSSETLRATPNLAKKPTGDDKVQPSAKA